MEPVQQLTNWENMTEIQATVHSVHVDQERGGVVLRFVIKFVSGEKVAVEMRGYEVRGLLEVDDRIVIRGRRLRDRDGVIRPSEVCNLTNGSTVTVRRASALLRFFSFVFGLIISLMSGVATSVLVTLFSGLVTTRSMSLPREGPREGPPVLGSGVTDPPVILAIILGISVALLVFYLIFLRSRAR